MRQRQFGSQTESQPVRRVATVMGKGPGVELDGVAPVGVAHRYAGGLPVDYGV